MDVSNTSFNDQNVMESDYSELSNNEHQNLDISDTNTSQPKLDTEAVQPSAQTILGHVHCRYDKSHECCLTYTRLHACAHNIHAHTHTHTQTHTHTNTNTHTHTHINTTTTRKHNLKDLLKSTKLHDFKYVCTFIIKHLNNKRPFIHLIQKLIGLIFFINNVKSTIA